VGALEGPRGDGKRDMIELACRSFSIECEYQRPALVRFLEELAQTIAAPKLGRVRKLTWSETPYVLLAEGGYSFVSSRAYHHPLG
jgi:hypothetical protein